VRQRPLSIRAAAMLAKLPDRAPGLRLVSRDAQVARALIRKGLARVVSHNATGDAYFCRGARAPKD